MDDSGTPACNLQIEPQDGCHPGDGVESIVTCLPSASDENENQLDGDGLELLTSSDSAMGKPEVFQQDSLNNNESCTPSCEVAASENSENISCFKLLFLTKNKQSSHPILCVLSCFLLFFS